MTHSYQLSVLWDYIVLIHINLQPLLIKTNQSKKGTETEDETESRKTDFYRQNDNDNFGFLMGVKLDLSLILYLRQRCLFGRRVSWMANALLIPWVTN